jgi:hypothetical protein
MPMPSGGWDGPVSASTMQARPAALGQVIGGLSGAARGWSATPVLELWPRVGDRFGFCEDDRA